MSVVLLNGIEIGTGSGRSKKAAEQHAAQMALEKLKSHLHEPVSDTRPE